MRPIGSIVAASVRAELARADISGRQLAERMSVSHAWVQRRLRGSVPFDVNELATIADLLNVPVSEFFEPAPRRPSPEPNGSAA